MKSARSTRAGLSRYLSIQYLSICREKSARHQCDATTARAAHSWQAAGDHVPAMSAPHAFALTVKDAGTGACTVLRVAPTTTAAALKQRLLSDGIAPPASRKVHLAHNGRMLQDDETLEAAGLALVDLKFSKTQTDRRDCSALVFSKHQNVRFPKI